MEYGLIGEHLGHSYSKEIHGMIADYEYELKEVAREELDSFMTARDFKAINVTIPYKQDVIPYLDVISPQAKEIGAVNTIVNKNGRLYGYNTDAAGMLALAGKIGIDMKGRKVLILGTGGTSKTAFAVAKELGASDIKKVSRKAGAEGCITYEQAENEYSDAEIIINTTPCGMYPNTDACPIDIDKFPDLQGVLDAIYNPLRSNLVTDALEKGIPAEGGLYMLSAQAVYACGYFLDREMSTADIKKAYEGVLSRKQNIIFIGMPTSGKTTIGKLTAEYTGRQFADTDDLVVERTGMSISDYFAAKGEQAFRDEESEVIKEICKKNAQVIATGGGAVLRAENVREMKKNGIVVFLDRSLENLITTDDRPLSSDRQALEKRYKERYDIYTAAADIRIEADGNIDEVAGKVRNALKI